MRNMKQLIIFLISSCLSMGFLVKVQGVDGFVKTNGTQFSLDGSPFYANGFNAYRLMLMASDASLRNKVSSAFQEATSIGLNIARTWAFSDGGSMPLQYYPGVYNEQMFEGLDFVISEASKHGIRLVLCLVNNNDDYGGKRRYVKWARSQGQCIRSKDDFFTNTLVRMYYKNHAKTVLTRRNSLTGIAYKDDPTIMAWELMNEPRCTSDPSGRTIQAWISEMASYVKSIDPNHLVEAGLEGFYGPSSAQKKQYNPNFQTGTDFIQNNQIPDIDFATVHSYPDIWLNGSSEEAQLSFLQNWVNIHIEDAQNILKKPLLFAEFGNFSKNLGNSTNQRDQRFDIVYSSAIHSSTAGDVAGGMFWQLPSEGILMDSSQDGCEVILSCKSPCSSTTLLMDLIRVSLDLLLLCVILFSITTIK